jgi:hypothetical protein
MNEVEAYRNNKSLGEFRSYRNVVTVYADELAATGKVDNLIYTPKAKNTKLMKHGWNDGVFIKLKNGNFLLNYMCPKLCIKRLGYINIELKEL